MFRNWLGFVSISLRSIKWVKFQGDWFSRDKYWRIPTDSPNIIYTKKEKKSQTSSGFYCFTINNRYVTQMWYNTVLYCHMIIFCAYIASIIAFVSSKTGIDDPRFNKYIILFSNQIFNIWNNQLAEIFKKFVRQNECNLGKRYFLNAFVEGAKLLPSQMTWKYLW